MKQSTYPACSSRRCSVNSEPDTCDRCDRSLKCINGKRWPWPRLRSCDCDGLCKACTRTGTRTAEGTSQCPVVVSLHPQLFIQGKLLHASDGKTRGDYTETSFHIASNMPTDVGVRLSLVGAVGARTKELGACGPL